MDAVTPLGVALGRLAAAAPDRPAVTDAERTITRAELDASTNRLARAYAACGVTQGSFVTIALPNGIEFVQAALATWKLGATPQPVSYRLPQRELDQILGLVEPALVVGLQTDGPNVPAGFTPDPGLSDGPLPPCTPPSFKAPTSGGSSGVPKVIVSTQPGTVEAVAGYASLGRITPDGAQLTTGPLYHNGPFLFGMAALMVGSHVVIMRRFDAADALRLVEEHRIDWMYSVPTMLHRFAKLPAEVREAADVSTLRTVITMAAACPQWLKELCVEWLGAATMLELYAATEAQAATLADGREWLERPGSVGRVRLGEIEVRDPDGAALPAGEVGELWMRRDAHEGGPYRYIGAEAQRSDGAWETVGDLGHFDADGYLYLADRKSDMIVVGGANVYPAEVEGALEEHPAVVSACVVGLPDDEYGNVVHAVVHAPAAVSDDELLDHLRERLVAYKLPRSFGRSDTPLRDDAGKVRRSQVREAVLAG